VRWSRALQAWWRERLDEDEWTLRTYTTWVLLYLRENARVSRCASRAKQLSCSHPDTPPYSRNCFYLLRTIRRLLSLSLSFTHKIPNVKSPQFAVSLTFSTRDFSLDSFPFLQIYLKVKNGSLEICRMVKPPLSNSEVPVKPTFRRAFAFYICSKEILAAVQIAFIRWHINSRLIQSRCLVCIAPVRTCICGAVYKDTLFCFTADSVNDSKWYGPTAIEAVPCIAYGHFFVVCCSTLHQSLAFLIITKKLYICAKQFRVFFRFIPSSSPSLNDR